VHKGQGNGKEPHQLAKRGYYSGKMTTGAPVLHGLERENTVLSFGRYIYRRQTDSIE
jgi:hypothetical protein